MKKCNLYRDEDFQKAPTISSDELNGVGWSRWVQDDYNYFAKTF
jgi:hypothetical protein